MSWPGFQLRLHILGVDTFLRFLELGHCRPDVTVAGEDCHGCLGHFLVGARQEDPGIGRLGFAFRIAGQTADVDVDVDVDGLQDAQDRIGRGDYRGRDAGEVIGCFFGGDARSEVVL